MHACTLILFFGYINIVVIIVSECIHHNVELVAEKKSFDLATQLPWYVSLQVSKIKEASTTVSMTSLFTAKSY